MANKKSALEEAKSLLSSIGGKISGTINSFKQDYANFQQAKQAKNERIKTDVQNFLSDSNPNKRLYIKSATEIPRVAYEAARQTLPGVASGLGNTIRTTGEQMANAIDRVPVLKIGINTPTIGIGPQTTPISIKPSTILRVGTKAAANTAEGIGSGATDLIQSAGKWYQNPRDISSYAQSLRGVGKIAFNAATPTTIANIIASSSDQGVAPRVAAGYLRGGNQVETLAPNVQAQKLQIGPISFDPAETVGQVAGFLRNPVNKKMFDLTQTYLPTAGNSLKTWLATTGLRGGVENIILSLPDMPNGTAQDKAKYLTENFMAGAAMEVAGQGVGEGIKATGKFSTKFLANVFDELSQLKTNILTKLEEPKIKLKDIGVEAPAVSAVVNKAEKSIGDLGVENPGTTALNGQIGEIKNNIETLTKQLRSTKDLGAKEGLKNEISYFKSQLDSLTGGSDQLTKAINDLSAHDKSQLQRILNGEKVGFDGDYLENPKAVENVLNLYSRSKGEGFTQAAQDAMANAPEPGKIKIKSQGQGMNTDIVQAFKNWVNGRRASRVEGYIKGKEFQTLDAEGMDAIMKFQAGAKQGMEKVQEYFNSKYSQLQKAGIDFNFRENYLPQLWNNTPEEINQVFNKRLSTKPGFTMQRMIETYQEGIAAGLTPRFSKMSDLVRWYETTANRAMADKQFFDQLAKDKFIMPQGNAPRDWVTLNPDSFPKISGKKSDILYKASPELASKINEYLATPTLSTNWLSKNLAKVAAFASSTKNRMLSFGIPGTGINAHGFNILARSYLERGVGGAVETAYYMVNPNAAAKVADHYMSIAPDAAKSGLTFSTGEYDNVIDNPEIRSMFAQKWDDLFEKPLFEKIITAKKLEGWSRLSKEYMKSMPEAQAKAEASKFMNTLYGGINWEELGRSRDLQNVLRSAILAPDWLESNLRLGKGMVTSLFDIKNPAGKAYRKAVTNLAASYVGLNVLNYMTSGHLMIQNDSGHTFELEAGYTADGQKRYIRPYGTAVDFARLPVDIAVSTLKGDYSAVGKIVRNRTSTLVQPVISYITDTDYKGDPAGWRGVDRYGRKMDPTTRMLSIGNQLGTAIGFPAVGQNIIDYATGKQGAEQAILQGLELPFRYSGGAYSDTQKEFTDLAKKSGATGKELYDLNKALSGQTLSQNQKGLIAQSTDPIGTINQIIDAKKVAADAKQKLKDSGADSLDSGDKWYVQDGDSVKAIDKNWTPEPLVKTGNETIDKKLASEYKSAINTRINDLILLAKKGIITQDELIQQVNALKKQYDSASGSGSTKKLSIKLPTFNSPKVKFATGSSSSSAGPKLSASITRSKIPASLKSIANQTYTVPRIVAKAPTKLVRAGMPTSLGGVGSV